MTRRGGRISLRWEQASDRAGGLTGLVLALTLVAGGLVAVEVTNAAPASAAVNDGIGKYDLTLVTDPPSAANWQKSSWETSVSPAEIKAGEGFSLSFKVTSTRQHTDGNWSYANCDLVDNPGVPSNWQNTYGDYIHFFPIEGVEFEYAHSDGNVYAFYQDPDAPYWEVTKPKWENWFYANRSSERWYDGPCVRGDSLTWYQRETQSMTVDLMPEATLDVKPGCYYVGPGLMGQATALRSGTGTFTAREAATWNRASPFTFLPSGSPSGDFAVLKVDVTDCNDPDPVSTEEETVEMYAPVVYLHPDDDHAPMSAEDFIDNSTLYWNHECAIGDPAQPDERITSAVNAALLGSGGYSATSEHVEQRSGACYYNKTGVSSASITRPYQSDAPYRHPGLETETAGFYLDVDNSFRDRVDARAFKGAPAYYQFEAGGGLANTPGYVVYWFFYPYSSPVKGVLDFAGLNHEGDWERVIVHLDTWNRATGVTYYYHHWHQYVPWSEVPKASPIHPTHPEVYSALEGHGSYWLEGDPLGPGFNSECDFVEPTAKEAAPKNRTWDECVDTGPEWLTWVNLVDVSTEDWWGYGGAWGSVANSGFAKSDRTGPLGPHPLRDPFGDAHRPSNDVPYESETTDMYPGDRDWTPVEVTDELAAGTEWPGSTVEQYLHTPSGERLGCADVRARGGFCSVTPTSVLMRVHKPESGTWQIERHATDVPATGERVSLWHLVEPIADPKDPTDPGDPGDPGDPVGSRFIDVPTGHTFFGDVDWLASEGITKGCNPPVNDRYCPDGVVTRGQMAAFLTRALGLTERLNNPFIDDDDSIFEADIERLAAAGITRGCNPPVNDRFCPDGKVTREVMAAFLVRALGYIDDGGGDLFIDDDDSIFEADIDRLGTAGVTRGCNPPTNDRFCPKGNVTRGQMAAFLHRALG